MCASALSTWNHEFATHSETGFVIPGPNSVYKHSSMCQNLKNLYIRGVFVYFSCCSWEFKLPGTRFSPSLLYTIALSTWNHEFATLSEIGFVITGPNSVYKDSSMYQNFQKPYIKGVLVYISCCWEFKLPGWEFKLPGCTSKLITVYDVIPYSMVMVVPRPGVHIGWD